MRGGPLPDATQWDQIEPGGACRSPVVEVLARLAAPGALIYQDATSVRIVSWIKAHQPLQARAQAQGCSRSQERPGRLTTALVVKGGERTLWLYYSGRSHAGENRAALLKQRQAGQDRPLVMSDALARNEVDAFAVIRCHCLVHGRRQCSDLAEVFPHEYRVAIDLLRDVFDHDEQSRQEQRSPAARLAYPQVFSGPLMAALTA
jgi:hypothetical protein